MAPDTSPQERLPSDMAVTFPVHITQSITMDFTTVGGKHLVIRIPHNVFDKLRSSLGNGYKAGCWVVGRCGEVDTLPVEAIARHISMMAKNLFLYESIKSYRTTPPFELSVGDLLCITQNAC